MENKGKGMLDPEEAKREVEKREEWRRREENILRWWESQTSLNLDFSTHPPLPDEPFAPRVVPTRQIEGPPPGYGYPPLHPVQPNQGASTSSQQARPSHIPVVTDRVRPADIQEFWRWIPTPDVTQPEPWYRLSNGFVRFRHGETWEEIDRRERAYASQREAARSQGVPILEEPPPQRPGERILRVVEGGRGVNDDYDENNDDDPREWPDEEPENVPEAENVNEPINEEENEDEEEDDDEEDEEDEGENQAANANPPAWSDTSTVTEEPTQVPPSRRRYIRGPRGYLGRRR